MRRILSSFVFILFFVSLSAQEINQTIPFRMSIRAAATVPHSLSNKAFRRSFTGIYNITAGYYYQVFHGFEAGLQFEHSLWKTADNKIPGLNTYAQTFHGGIRVGYDRVVGTNSVAFVGISFMEGMIKFYGLSIQSGTDLTNFRSHFNYNQVCADAGVFFYTEGSFAIGIHFGADFSNYHFDPYSIFLNQHKAYVASDLNGTFAQLNVGFSVVYSFDSNKPKAQ
ncbi:MAG TPA: hypothetical protein VL651_16005 [Bacteroidia bacterium]|jgi:hypothetical protein|nr:hypothetical protein [Bacteroidia bacterium]